MENKTKQNRESQKSRGRQEESLPPPPPNLPPPPPPFRPCPSPPPPPPPLHQCSPLTVTIKDTQILATMTGHPCSRGFCFRTENPNPPPPLPMLTPKGKIPSTGKILPRGESNPRRYIKHDSEPNTLPTSYSDPCLFLSTAKSFIHCPFLGRCAQPISSSCSLLKPIPRRCLHGRLERRPLPFPTPPPR